MSEKKKNIPASNEAPQDATNGILLVGLDLGTNASCLQAINTDTGERVLNETIPTVVGYARTGLLEGILPNDAEILFGAEALRHRLHLKMVRPLRNGVIENVTATRDFAKHLRSRLPAGYREIRAVIGVPARAGNNAREAVRRAFDGLVHKVILIPEPFLAALGCRDEEKIGSEGYVDPVSNSLFVDIGAGSTDLCLVQGYYPRPEDQISIGFAGDSVDASLASQIAQKYPDCDLSLERVREIKEEYSFVDNPSRQIVVKRIIGGKARNLELGQEIAASCHELLDLVFDNIKQMIAMAEPDTVPELMRNIIITGGGSRIEGIAEAVQNRLEGEDYDQPNARTLGSSYKEFVARGALKAARAARERQWQTLMSNLVTA